MSHETNPEDLNNRDVAAKLLQEKPKDLESPPTFWFSKRCLLVILLFFGNFNMVMLKSNVNIAIVQMTYTINITDANTNITTTTEPEFNWDSKTIGVVLSAFSCGYIFCVGGGQLATAFGGATMCGVSLMVMAVVTMLTPLGLSIDFYLFLFCRFVVGLMDGFAYTSSAELLSRWAPVQERSTMMSMVFCGIYIGIASTYPFCGFIAQRWGWRMIFYTTGVISMIWSVLWLLLIRNQPSKDSRISKRELQYIMENTETTPRKEVVHPYGKIFTSSRVWALCVSKFTYSWGYTLLVTCFPLYVTDMTHRPTNEIGFISSIPNFVCIFMIPLAGTVMDYWQNNSNLKAHQIHKIVMCTGYFFAASLFIAAALANNFVLSMICFVLIKLMLSFNFLILQLICIYMAPKHSSVIAGVSAFWYTMSCISVPTAVGFIVTTRSLEEWNMCFFSSGGVLMLGGVAYLLYGSSELQPWGMSSSFSTEDKNIKNKSIDK